MNDLFCPNCDLVGLEESHCTSCGGAVGILCRECGSEFCEIFAGSAHCSCDKTEESYFCYSCLSWVAPGECPHWLLIFETDDEIPF